MICAERCKRIAFHASSGPHEPFRRRDRVAWWVMLLAIGTGVVAERRAGPIAVALYAVYTIMAVAVTQMRLSG